MSLFDSQMQIPQAALDAVSNVIGEAQSLGKKALGFFQPSQARLAAANLLPGGANAASKNDAPAKFAGGVIDWRVKIKLAESAKYFYNAATPAEQGIMAPLHGTGVIFPYTPNITVTHAARYGSQQLTHSNYTNYAYEGSEVQAITIAGEFTAQTQTEANYVLACIQFFRAATKMWFGGKSGVNVGNPPPMVFLTGYGDNYFPNVPCVITSFAHTMPADVDYIEALASFEIKSTAATVPSPVQVKPGESAMARAAVMPSTISSVKTTSTMIPTQSQISITLQPIYSRKNIYDNFSLDNFAKGALISGKGGFI